MTMQNQIINSGFRLVNFGCQMNLADSQRIKGILTGLGMRESRPDETPQMVVFNTCCVRLHAEERLIGRVRSLKKLKQAHPELLIVVAGCMVQKMRRKMFDILPMIDVILGPNDIELLPELISKALHYREAFPNQAKANISGPFTHSGVFSGDYSDGIVLSRPFSALVNIIRGCTNNCAYCIVPQVRGPEISRPMNDLVDFVKQLAERGVKEITLLGQNVNAYGKDIGLADGFVKLLEEVNKINGIHWIRFLTSHPRDFSKGVIKRMASIEKLCPQYHLPVQAGSSRILSLMNRGYNRDQYLDLVRSIRESIKEVTLTTDIICGFPSETESEFMETLSLVEEVHFESAYMYYYSPRDGTKAAGMAEQIPETVRKRRLADLIELQNRIALEESQKLKGKKMEILVEGFSERNPCRLAGKASSGRTVDFDGTPELIGRFVPVRITDARTWTISGVLEL